MTGDSLRTPSAHPCWTNVFDRTQDRLVQFPPTNLHQLSDHWRTNSGDVNRSRRRTGLQELFELQLYVSTPTEVCCCNRVGGCLRLKGTFGSVRDRAGKMAFLIAAIL